MNTPDHTSARALARSVELIQATADDDHLRAATVIAHLDRDEALMLASTLAASCVETLRLINPTDPAGEFLKMLMED